MVVLPDRLGNLYAAEPGFVLRRNPDTLVAPDVAFVRAERLAPDRDRRRFLQIVPDLAVEVISPSDSARLVARKIEAYRQAGTPLLVAIYPEQREVVVYRAGREPVILRDADVLDASDIVPGFRLPISNLFE